MGDTVLWLKSISCDEAEAVGYWNHGTESDSDNTSEIEFQLYSQVHYSSENSDLTTQIPVLPAGNVEDNAKLAKLYDEHEDNCCGVGSSDEVTDGGDFWLQMTNIDILSDWKNVNTTLKVGKLDKGNHKNISGKLKIAETTTKSSHTGMTHGEKESTKLDKSDLQKLRRYLSDSNEDEFVPESWEIVDTAEGDDSDDQGVDIHVSREGEQEETPLWTPGQGSPASWQIDIKDRRLLFPGERSRYYAGSKGIRCKNCNETGHKAINCPEPKKQQVCYQCGEEGHVGRECPESRHLFIRGRGKECDRCGQRDHIRADCPDIWRQFHITTTQGPLVIPKIPVKLNSNVQCHVCAAEGHFGHECEDGPWSYHTVLAPFVHRYDGHIVVGEGKDLRFKLKTKSKKTAKGAKNDEQNGDDGKKRKNMSAVTKFFHSAAQTVSSRLANFTGKKKTPIKINIAPRDAPKSSSAGDPGTTNRWKRKYDCDEDVAKRAKKKKTSHCERAPVEPRHEERFVSLKPRTSFNHHDDRHSSGSGRKVVFQRTSREEQPFPRNPRNTFYHKEREVKFSGKWRRNDDAKREQNKKRDRGFRKRFGLKK